MSTRLDRMIARARAPLSALRPVMPSAFSAERPSPIDAVESSVDFAERPESHPAVPGYARRAASAADGQVNASDLLPRNNEVPMGPRSIWAGGVNFTAADHPAEPGNVAPSEKTAQPMSGATPQPPLSASPVFPSDHPVNANLPKQFNLGELSKSSEITLPSHSAVAAMDRIAQNQSLQDFAESVAPIANAMKNGAPAANAPAPEYEEAPVEVNISIGSIDFRSARTAEPVKRSPAHPHVTLDSYLQRGKREGR